MRGIDDQGLHASLSYRINRGAAFDQGGQGWNVYASPRGPEPRAPDASDALVDLINALSGLKTALGMTQTALCITERAFRTPDLALARAFCALCGPHRAVCGLKPALWGLKSAWIAWKHATNLPAEKNSKVLSVDTDNHLVAEV